VALLNTVIVTFLVITGGLAPAYVYLSTLAFYLIVFVLGADILLGIALRTWLRRRTQKKKIA